MKSTRFIMAGCDCDIERQRTGANGTSCVRTAAISPHRLIAILTRSTARPVSFGRLPWGHSIRRLSCCRRIALCGSSLPPALIAESPQRSGCLMQQAGTASCLPRVTEATRARSRIARWQRHCSEDSPSGAPTPDTRVMGLLSALAILRRFATGPIAARTSLPKMRRR